MGTMEKALIILLSAGAFITFMFRTKAKPVNNPPGPKPLPFIGNLLDFPRSRQWVVFKNWTKQYGDVIYMNVMGTPIVVLNSMEACINLLDKRSSIYSGRPRSVLLSEFLGHDDNFGFMDYSPRWRKYRRLFHQHFNEHVVLNYRPIQERCVLRFLQRLLTAPDDFFDHIRLLFGETILDVVYGIKVEDRDDVFINAAEKALEATVEGAKPGRFLVDFFPAMKYLPSWFPGGTFKKFAEERKPKVLNAKDLPFYFVKKQMEDGTAEVSVLSSMLSQEQMAGIESNETLEDIAKGCAAIAYLTGSDTTLAAIQGFFMAMANHPEVQRAAWMEIDTLFGPTPNRLPTFEDKARLPFIVAITKELLRWHTVSPMGFPHVLTEDDEYDGYSIRKGTVVFANIWGLMHDPESYPDPFTFNPWRWLLETPEGFKLNLNMPDPVAAFGFGRRQVFSPSAISRFLLTLSDSKCPGRHFASDSLFNTVVTVLTCFDIRPLDADGQPADRIKEDFVDELLVYPVPYKVSITARSGYWAQLIKDVEV